MVGRETFNKLDDTIHCAGRRPFANLTDVNSADGVPGYAGGMGEALQNNAQKREQLKTVIRELHAGSDIKQIRKRFGSLIEQTSPEEIAAMEQDLMREGMSVSDIQALCEVHVAVFQQQLEKQKHGHVLPGHPIHTYKLENRHARGLIRRMRRAARAFAWGLGGEGFGAALEELSGIEVHFQRKENQLFPFLEEVGFDAPSKVMWGKHDEIRAELKALRKAFAAADRAEVGKRSRAVARLMRAMIFMEERILFPTAARKLTDRHWAVIRFGEPSIGYAWVKPGDTWDPTVVMMNEAAGMGSAEMRRPVQPKEAVVTQPGSRPASASTDADPLVELSVGALRASEVDTMLRALPFDISYVDEHDRVRYYSDSADRIFPRSPGIIGREVQNCHPPKSVHIVEEIVRAFRAGEQDRAEFWIPMKGRFIHILYVALRDRDGGYRGVLEVSQDATHVRSLQGEQRLLDWNTPR